MRSERSREPHQDSRLVDEVCDQFETAWRAGQAPQLEDFLGPAESPQMRARLLGELLVAEWDLRIDQQQKFDVEEYFARFPTQTELIGKRFEQWELEGHDAGPTDGPSFEDTQPLDPANLEEEKLPQPGTEFAGYELLEKLGSGGMGVVFRARQRHPERVIALKMIRSGQFASSEDVQRFRAEVSIAASSDHEGIVPIYDVGESQGQHFYTMKLVVGQSLADHLEHESLTVQQLVLVIFRAAQAMARCHDKAIVHRDLKPSNILIDQDGHPQILDFGLAKHLGHGNDLTLAGDIIGTPGYMPPEQANGRASCAGPQADVYSLGAILYHGLTGRPPIVSERGDLALTIQRILEHDIVPPRAITRRVPRQLNTICEKCLLTEPEGRYAHAGQLADDLDRFLAGEAIEAQSPNAAAVYSRWARQHPGLAATWTALAFFYAYHLVLRLVRPDIGTMAFHVSATIVIAIWSLGAWYCQRGLIRSGGGARYLYLWTTLEAVMVTVLLASGRGPQSVLVFFYHVLVAVSILRFSVALVSFATGLSIAGYLFQVLHVSITDPTLLPEFHAAISFVLSLLTLGFIQHLALRRSRQAFELHGK